MSLAATPPTPRRHSRRWYVAVFSLTTIVVLTGLAGGVHWYGLYARSLGPTATPSVLYFPPDTAPTKAKAPKANGGEQAGGSARATSDGQANSTEKVSNHKSNAKPTATPGV